MWIWLAIIGCLIYVVKLLIPSVIELQKLVDTCYQFGVEYSLAFNQNNIIYLKYGICDYVMCVYKRKLMCNKR